MGYLHRGSLVLVNRLDAEALKKRLNRKTGTFLGVIIGIERFWLNSSGVGCVFYIPVLSIIGFVIYKIVKKVM